MHKSSDARARARSISRVIESTMSACGPTLCIEINLRRPGYAEYPCWKLSFRFRSRVGTLSLSIFFNSLLNHTPFVLPTTYIASTGCLSGLLPSARSRLKGKHSSNMRYNHRNSTLLFSVLARAHSPRPRSKPKLSAPGFTIRGRILFILSRDFKFGLQSPL